MATTKKLLALQSVILFAGTVFAWSKLIPQFVDFYALYGTFFRVSDCIVPNPFVTACFYGSAAFLVALYASVRLYQNPNVKGVRNLRNFLVFCVTFAGSVVLSEAATYYHWISSSISVTCSPGIAPIYTPCFTGMLCFLAAAVVAFFAVRASSESVSGTIAE